MRYGLSDQGRFEFSGWLPRWLGLPAWTHEGVPPYAVADWAEEQGVDWLAAMFRTLANKEKLLEDW